MRRILEITASGLGMAMQELLKNKLRTFLSLFGVTIGIFCIIGVLATVNSLESNIQSQLKDMGNNTIYLDKWDWGGGPDYPFWKFAKRPLPRYEEVQEIRTRTYAAKYVSFFINSMSGVEVGSNTLSNVRLYGVTEDYPSIQPLDLIGGRMITENEFRRGSNVTIMGSEIAEKLFGEPEYAINKNVTVKGRTMLVVGVIRRQGSQIVGGWQFDKAMIVPYMYQRTLFDEKRSSPLIMVKGQDHITSKVLKEELTGVMRSVRRLNLTQENNFGLNDINEFGESMSKAFVSVNIGGWAIGALSFIVGIFGVANIMFVTVKERTPQIGLKKAIGAKKSTILLEFLLESAFLCLFGGLIGLLLVYVLTRIVTAVFDFPLFLSVPIMMLAVVICIVAGILAGIIPASQAARMDPVVAIRSK